MSRIGAEVSSLHFYPIKSCDAVNLTAGGLEVGEKGFQYDRHWMVVNSDGLFLTQREFPKMALIKPTLEEDRLAISAQGEASILEIPFDYNGQMKEVEIWGNRCEAVDNGDIASQWFSDFLGKGVQARLVHMANNFIREKKPGYGRLEFADSYPFLLVSEESLQDLNERILANGGQTVPMNRFRPNIVVKGVAPYAEDSWGRVRINDVRFDIVKPCVRCPIPQIDQQTGIKGKEPTKTLLGYRRVSRTEVIFAQKAVNLDTGSIEVGQNVEVLEKKESPHTI